MGIPLKIRLRQFIKEFKCPHKEYTSKYRTWGAVDFVVCECKECGKSWVIK